MADKLDIAPTTLSDMAARGDFPSVKVGRNRRVREDVILAMAEGRDPWSVVESEVSSDA
jgi:hypothetical protein